MPGPSTAPTEARVARLDVDDAKKAAATVGVSDRLAELNVFRVLLHHPRLSQAISGLLGTLLFEGNELDPRLRELLILRIAWVTGSDYEWSQHWRMALSLDLPEEDAVAVREWRHSDRFSEADRAILSATDEVLADGVISRATWDQCERHLGGARELVELVVAIGNWRMLSVLLRSLEVPLDDDLSSWPPDGTPPDGAPPDGTSPGGASAGD